MHPILQLDRDLWTLRRHGGIPQLRHATGMRLTLLLDSMEWNVLDATTTLERPVLRCTGRIMPLAPRKSWIFEHLDHVAGADAQDSFARMQARVRRLAILAGHSGYLRLERDRDGISWYTSPMARRRAKVFGPHQKRASALVAEVAHVATQSLNHDGTGSFYWTHRTECVWDIQYTSHERLAILAEEA